MNLSYFYIVRTSHNNPKYAYNHTLKNIPPAFMLYGACSMNSHLALTWEGITS